MPDSLIIRALKTVQGENAIYSFFINGQDIFKVADISRISRDETGRLKVFKENLYSVILPV